MRHFCLSERSRILAEVLWEGHSQSCYGLKAQLRVMPLQGIQTPCPESCPALLRLNILRKKGERETKPVLSHLLPLWHAGHEHVKASTGGPGVPGTAEAPLGTEGIVHNKAMEHPHPRIWIYLSHIQELVVKLVKLLPSG